MNKLVIASFLTCALVLAGCVSLEGTKAQLASGDAAQREAARKTIIAKVKDLYRLGLEERLKWIDIVQDNETLYVLCDELHLNGFGSYARDDYGVKSAVIQKFNLSTKAEAIKFINWARTASGGDFRQKAMSAIGLLNEDEVYAILDKGRQGRDYHGEDSLAHDLSVHLAETAQSPELLGRLLTEEHILLGISNFDTQKKVWAKIEARLLPKVDALSVEMAEKLLVGAGENQFKHHLTNGKLIAKLIAKLPKEKQKEPQTILDRMLADEAEKNPCVVDGVDWQGLFHVYDGKAYINRRDYQKKADYLPENLVIPSSLAGYPVVEVGDLGYFKLKSVVIPDSVKIIGGFGGGFLTTESELPCCATSLEKVVIGNGAEVINGYAFDRCRNLREVIIGAGVTNIGENAFSGCHNLTNVTIEGKQRRLEIGRRAFQNCKSLKTFKSNTGYTFYYSDTFDGCDEFYNDDGLRIVCGVVDGFNGKSKEVVIPKGVKDIGNWAFAGATRLKSIVIPEGVTRIGEGAFSGCKALQAVVIPRSVQTIHRKAFMGCVVLRQVSLLNPDTEIKDNAFYDCDNLQWVETPETKYRPSTWDNFRTLRD